MLFLIITASRNAIGLVSSCQVILLLFNLNFTLLKNNNLMDLICKITVCISIVSPSFIEDSSTILWCLCRLFFCVGFEAFDEVLRWNMYPFFVNHVEATIGFFQMNKVEFPRLKNGINFFYSFFLFDQLIFQILLFKSLIWLIRSIFRK